MVAVINSEFTIKRLSNVDGKVFLIPENDDFKRIEITETMDFKVWGVVSYVIKKM